MGAPEGHPPGPRAVVSVVRSGLRTVAWLFGAISLAGALWFPFGSSGLGASDWLFWLVAAPVVTLGGAAVKRRMGLRVGHPALATLATRRSGNQLSALRGIFFSFLGAFVSMIVVAFILDGKVGAGPEPGPVALGVGIFGIAMLVAGRFAERPLDCSSAETLLNTYRTRFFVRVAFAESSALAGFIGVIVTGAGWVYLVGLAFSLVGFARLAPTDSRLRTEQFELTSAGCGQDLMTLLNAEPDAT